MEKEGTKLFPIWKELVKAALEWQYGSFHTHKEIADIMGVDPQSPRYYAAISKARENLIQCGRLLETLTDRGYLVTEVNRYNEVTLEDVKKSRKYLELSVLKSQFAPVEKMDESTRKRHDIFVVKQAGLLNMSAPLYTEITKVITPIPSRFQIKEKKPKELKDNEIYRNDD